ncbi:N-acetylmuramoyl-L-alanine amidase [Desulfohalotomaculum tongense]|uniref:cell wall hydrolase n=1 Tax=Desulforadius tongensis TaxID=1216062 RepID=UPI00195D8826|nr:cell wall hydrolase [Desulforadius tongensis]MBM7855601.1 N-acetylmuramoyl-L-alanine amidase [Desulforadius tongensis]
MYKKIRMLAVSLTVMMTVTAVLTGAAMAGEGSDTIATQVAQGEPSNPDMSYIVQEGDTLYGISRKFNLTVASLMRYNGLDNTTILVGQKLYLPLENPPAVAVISRSKVNISLEEVDLLARLIHAEARGESFVGKVAVGAVILNRLKSPYFPHTIKEVIMQKNHRVYQFSPVGDGSINLKPDKSSKLAAIQALKGDDPTNGALFFYNPNASSDTWIRTLPVITRIGNHVFASIKA